MAQPYVGEIRMFAGTFAPVGWLFCSGQQLPISENEILFQLIGTTYGGDGQETFNLPDLRGRIPIHQGNGTILAESSGVEEVTLTVQQIPSHSHPFMASSGGASDSNPANDVLAENIAISAYQSTAPNSPMAAGSVSLTGGSQPHTNVQPYLCINYIISLFGLFPSPT